MRIRSLALAAALLATPWAAKAQPFQGLYIGAGAGYNLPMGIHTQPNVFPLPPVQIYPSGGVVALGSVGYGLGNGFRFEVEGNYRQGDVNTVHSPLPQVVSGKLRTYGAMVNAMFDMDIGEPWL